MAFVQEYVLENLHVLKYPGPSFSSNQALQLSRDISSRMKLPTTVRCACGRSVQGSYTTVTSPALDMNARQRPAFHSIFRLSYLPPLVCVGDDLPRRGAPAVSRAGGAITPPWPRSVLPCAQPIGRLRRSRDSAALACSSYPVSGLGPRQARSPRDTTAETDPCYPYRSALQGRRLAIGFTQILTRPPGFGAGFPLFRRPCHSLSPLR